MHQNAIAHRVWILPLGTPAMIDEAAPRYTQARTWQGAEPLAARGAVSRQRGRRRDALGKPDERHKELRKELSGARKERTAALEVQCNGLSAPAPAMMAPGRS